MMLRRACALALAAVVLVIGLPATAWSAVPTDPRITAAVAAWKDQPVYVDPQYTSAYADQVEAMQARIATSPVPVYVAVVPTGTWYLEKGDTELLAGWLATANGKPGLYLVMEDWIATGIEHQVHAWGPSRTYGDSKQTPAQLLGEYLDEVKVNDRYDADPARTEPLPPREDGPDSPPERFTVGKAIGNGVGGGLIGLMGGALVAALVLGLAALVARRGGRQ
ncbi:hypothetical protein [Kribbella sp. NPDC051770]|uniref:hypothetical protein n=1 Tax=Kribbella sp. NPDC051770 TaxID=3155413 RepID=UPI003433D897